MSYIKKIAVLIIVVLSFTTCDSLEGGIEDVRTTLTLETVKVSGDGDVKTFQMMKYPVTQAAYNMIMDPKPGYLEPGFDEWRKDFKAHGILPAVKVSWYQAIVYCNKLSIQQGLNPVYRINGKTDPSGWGSVPKDNKARLLENWQNVEQLNANGYRLPTEAEWEYAAREGKAKSTDKYSGENDNPKEVAWYEENSGKKTHPVGTLKPNSLGIYHMSGNVEEWCWAEKDDTPEKRSPVTRGGSWKSGETDIMVTSKHTGLKPYDKEDFIGLRLVRN